MATHDGYGMTWADIDDAAEDFSGWNEASRDDYSVEDVIEEIHRVVSDELRLLYERPEQRDAGAAAAIAAAVRDEQRPRFGDAGLGHIATLYVVWLVERAPGNDRRAKLAVAEQAAAGSQGSEVLGDELRAFVEGRLDGTISDSQFVKHLKKPFAPLRRT